LGGRHQIDVVGALILETEKDFGQLRNGQLFPKPFMADGIILAETAPQGAAAEKDRAAAFRAADTGFLPVMQGGAGGSDGGSASAVSRCPGPVCLAEAGTESTGKVSFGWYHGGSFEVIFRWLIHFPILMANGRKGKGFSGCQPEKNKIY